ncbi:MAG: BamA/TamA family outer membrane protein [Verrucomicrobiales bacterium]|nr:BamA/TamA family outer membrane protein [Verrucomicrobiales bacterium]
MEDERIQSAFADAAGHAVTLEQIGVGMARLRRLYCESGFPSAHVRLQQQILRDRTVQILVDEGPRAPKKESPPEPPLGFEIRGYQVVGNSLLTPETLDAVFAQATGPAVTLDQVRQAAGQLQLAYRERGFLTVAVGIPAQQITNATLRIQVTEGTLTDLRVTGERYFSSNNVRRALPSLRTDEIPNSRILQRELDLANQNPDRQIFPTFGPGPEPGTSALTLRVEDRLPLHGRVEVNNLSTPETPEWRINTSLQYLNLWQLDHQAGLSYGFSPEAYKPGDLDRGFPLDRPQIAYYGAFYRMPLGAPSSVADRIAGQPGFGYDEASRQFLLPAASARPELSLYGSFASSDTGLQSGPATIVTHTPLLTIVSQDTGRNLSENGSAGARLQWPVVSSDRQRLALTVGPDWKTYRLESFNTNTFVVTTVVTNLQGTQIIENRVASPQPTRRYDLDYLPVTVGLDYSRTDSTGRTYGSLAMSGNAVGDTADFRAVAYSPSARAAYGRALLQAQREQRIAGGWTAALRLSGQAATGPLISNEQFAVGGVSSVRGYYEGDEYGDAGWFTNVEFRTPLLQRSVAFGSRSAPIALRGWVFADLGQRWLLDADAAAEVSRTLLGTGAGISASLDQYIDLRIIVGWPLLDTPNTPAGDPRAYFTLGGQF